MIIQCHRQNPSLQQLTFTGACCSCYQTVRTMCLFMNIKRKCFASSKHANRSCQTLIRLRLSPSAFCIQLLHSLHTIPLQKSHWFWYWCWNCKSLQLNCRHSSRENIIIITFQIVIHCKNKLIIYFISQICTWSVIDINNHFAVMRQRIQIIK